MAGMVEEGAGGGEAKIMRARMDSVRGKGAPFQAITSQCPYLGGIGLGRGRGADTSSRRFGGGGGGSSQVLNVNDGGFVFWRPSSVGTITNRETFLGTLL